MGQDSGGNKGAGFRWKRENFARGNLTNSQSVLVVLLGCFYHVLSNFLKIVGWLVPQNLSESTQLTAPTPPADVAAPRLFLADASATRAWFRADVTPSDHRFRCVFCHGKSGPVRID